MSKGFFKGVLLGGIALGITALLFAPKSGKKIRGELKESYEDVKEGTQEVLKDLKKHSKAFVKDSKKTTKDVLKRNKQMRS